MAARVCGSFVSFEANRAYCDSADLSAATDATVRRVYKRAQLEKAWIEASGGMVYVIEAQK